MLLAFGIARAVASRLMYLNIRTMTVTPMPSMTTIITSQTTRPHPMTPHAAAPSSGDAKAEIADIRIIRLGSKTRPVFIIERLLFLSMRILGEERNYRKPPLGAQAFCRCDRAPLDCQF